MLAEFTVLPVEASTQQPGTISILRPSELFRPWHRGLTVLLILLKGLAVAELEIRVLLPLINIHTTAILIC